jgi:hypothetical protein
MRPQTRHKLDEIMLRYDRLLDKAADQPSEPETMQERFRILCTETIEPMMRVFGEVLESYGHSVRIYGRPMSVGSGGFSQSAEMIMQVSPRRVRSEAAVKEDEGYRISFAFATPQNKILACLANANGACTAPQHDLHPLEGVTDALIEAELLEMVGRIFDEEEAGIARHHSSAPRASVALHPAMRLHS